MENGTLSQHRKGSRSTILYSRLLLVFLVGTLVIIFTALTHLHLDRRARGYTITKRATPVIAARSKYPSYYKKLVDAPGYAEDQATVTHPLNESFITHSEKCYNCTKKLVDVAEDQAIVKHPLRRESFIPHSEKCHNCLPNYFIRADESDKSKYRRGTVGFLHHLKSGGTTIHSCLRKLLSTPYTWNGKTEKRRNRVFIEDFGFDKRKSWKKLNETSRLAYHFLGGTAVMGLCDDFQIDRTPPPCSYFTVLRDPIDRAVATYFYCKVRPSDMLCATHKLKATQSNITEWALHQRSFLFTQLTLDRQFCARFSMKEQWSVPCWHRQRIAMEQANLETKLHFILEDITDRFAVIGMLDHLEESLSMFETVRFKKINYSTLY